MATLGSLAAPLLLRRGIRDNVNAFSDKSEKGAVSESIIICSSSAEYMRYVCGGATTQENSVEQISEEEEGEETSTSFSSLLTSAATSVANGTAQSQFCFTHEWTFASSSSPDTKLGWSAITTNRLDQVLQIWSQITSCLTSPRIDRSIYVSFFPTKFVGCSMHPMDTAHSCYGVYYEVRTHIPIRLHKSISDTSNDASSSSSSSSSGIRNEAAQYDSLDNLEEFMKSRRMLARRLRALIHDATMSFMSSAVRCVSPPTVDNVLQCDPSSVSAADDSVHGDASDCPGNSTRMDFKPIHNLLLPLCTPLTPPIPTVLAIKIEEADIPSDHNHHDSAATPATEENMTSTNITVSLHTVVHMTRPRLGEVPRWRPETIACETLASLLPPRFALQAASRVEVGEVSSDGSVSDWLQFSGAEAYGAWEQLRQARDAHSPTHAHINTHGHRPVPTATTSGSVKTQHNPYSVLTLTPTPHTSHAVNSCSLESAEEEAMTVKGVVRQDSSGGESSCSANYNAAYGQKREDESSERISDSVEKGNTTTENNNSNSSSSSSSSNNNNNNNNVKVEADAPVEEKEEAAKENGNGNENDNVEEEEEREEEVEMVIDGVKQTILSLSEECVACRDEGEELLRALQRQLSSLISQFACEKDLSTTRRKGNRSVKFRTEDDTGALTFLSTFFGASFLTASEEERLHNATTVLIHYVISDARYSTFDEFTMDVAADIHALETRLRAESLLTLDNSADKKLPFKNGGIPVKKTKNKKKDVSLFAPAVKCLSQEHDRQFNPQCKKPNEKNGHDISNNNNNGGTVTVLRCSSSSSLSEVRQLIDDTYKKLRAAIKWGNQRVAELRITDRVCREMFAPCLDARVALVREEQKGRSELEIGYIVSLAILREPSNSTNEEQEEKEKTEEKGEEIKEKTTPSVNEKVKHVAIDDDDDGIINNVMDAAREKECSQTEKEFREDTNMARHVVLPTSSPATSTVTAARRREKNNLVPLRSHGGSNSNSGRVKRDFYHSPKESAQEERIRNVTLAAVVILCGLGTLVFFLA